MESEPQIIFQTPVSAVIDGNDGPGQCVSIKAMDLAIEKASKNMIGLVTVKNSNHYGITAYYSEKALKKDMIGIAMTNSYPLVVPTFGKESILGTNPLSVGIPAINYPFLLDMATSVVTRGKIEVYRRHNKEILPGWAINKEGITTKSPDEVINNFNERNYGGILPLGGIGEESGGHKGFGLSLLVDLLTAGLSLGQFSSKTYQSKKPGVCHFFGAINLDIFGNKNKIKENIDSIIKEVKNSKKANGKNKIYYHGEKEYQAREESLKNGVKILNKTYDELKKIALKNNINLIRI